MEMTFKLAVSPEGVDYHLIHAYLVSKQSANLSGSIFEKLTDVPFETYDITPEESDRNVWVLEATVKRFDEFAGVALQLLNNSASHNSMSLCVLMFDGAYGGLDMILGNEIADHIYGFSSNETGPVICLDLTMLRSDAWRSMIEYANRNWLGQPSRSAQ